MPAFLILSGYLVNVRKTPAAFARSVLWLFIPYAIMESGYAFMASVLPIRESIDRFTWSVLLEKVFVRPLGPYWYLHTLILCSLIYYITFRYVRLSPDWLWLASACLPFPIAED